MAIGAEVQTLKTTIIVKTTWGEERFDAAQHFAVEGDGRLRIFQQGPNLTQWLAAVYAPGAWLSYRMQAGSAESCARVTKPRDALPSFVG